MLRLYGEEPGGDEALHVGDARPPAGLLLAVGQVVGLEVAVNKADDVVDHRVCRPRGVERQCEEQQQDGPSGDE